MLWLGWYLAIGFALHFAGDALGFQTKNYRAELACCLLWPLVVIVIFGEVIRQEIKMRSRLRQQRGE